MRSRLIPLALSLILLSSCTTSIEPTISTASDESGESETVSVTESIPADEEAGAKEKDEVSDDEEKEPAWTNWGFLDVPITREQAGLDTIPAHTMNGHTPDEYWLSVADGSRPYTDEHFSWGVRHGMEFPFMRFNQRDIVMFLVGYQGELIAGLRVGDPMSEVVDRLGEPTLRETYRLDRGYYDEFFDQSEGQLDSKSFLHYKGDGFYVSFMGDDNVEVIGLKRAAISDYDPDILKNWRETLIWHKDGPYLEYRESFFQSLNKNSWMGGTSVSNVGLYVSEYEDALATVYNDFQGNLYICVLEEQYDPDEWEQMTFESGQGGVQFINEDSNFVSFRNYMYEYALLEKQFAQSKVTSPNGRYRVVSESVRPYNHHLCFRSNDMATKDRLHTWMGGPVSHWLDDDYFLVVDMNGNPALYHVEQQDKINNPVMQRLEDSYASMNGDSFDRDHQTFSVWDGKTDDLWLIHWSYSANGKLEMTME